MIYLVTDGSYSDYTVMSAFTTSEAAEAFRHYHDYERVEEIQLDPYTPLCDQDTFRVIYDIEKKSLRTTRVSNSQELTDWDIWGKEPEQLVRIIFAVSEDKAKRWAKESLEYLFKGSMSVNSKCYRLCADDEFSRAEHKCFEQTYTFKDGKPSLVKEVQVD